MLTEAEYESIAGSMDLPTNAFINGRFMAAKSGRTVPSVNPATGEQIGETLRRKRLDAIDASRVRG